MIVTFKEESDYGQDVLLLAAMVAELMQHEWTKGEIILQMKKIRNVSDVITDRVKVPYNNKSYFGMEVVEKEITIDPERPFWKKMERIEQSEFKGVCPLCGCDGFAKRYGQFDPMGLNVYYCMNCHRNYQILPKKTSSEVVE